MFKRIKKNNNKVINEPKINETNQVDTSNLTRKLTHNVELVANFTGIPIKRIKNVNGSKLSQHFKGHELTIITKPYVIYVPSSFIVYNKLNTICHEIRYTGDRSKKLIIRLRLALDHYAEFYLGNNEFKSLYITKTRDNILITYREKYDVELTQDQKPKKPKYVRKTNIKIIESDLFSKSNE